VLFTSNVFVTRFLLPLLFTFLPVTLFYLLDTRLKLKAKLIQKFSTVKSYKITLVVICLILYALYMTLLYRMGSSLFFTSFAIIFLYQYLMYKPERCLTSEKSATKE